MPVQETKRMLSLTADIMLRGMQDETAGMISGMKTYLEGLRRNGVTDENVIKLLQDDFNLGEDSRFFGPIINNLKAGAQDFIQNAANKEKNLVLEKAYDDLDNQEFTWVATMVKTCPDCVELHGVSKTYREWQEEGEPNIRPTICTLNGYCHCQLVPNSGMNDADRTAITEPIQLQKEKIAAYEKEKGPLSDGYKDALLGQANNPASIVNGPPEQPDDQKPATEPPPVPEVQPDAPTPEPEASREDGPAPVGTKDSQRLTSPEDYENLTAKEGMNLKQSLQRPSGGKKLETMKPSRP